MVDVKHNGLELGLKWPLLNQWNLTQGLFDIKNYNYSCNHDHCIAGYLFATVWRILYQQHISSLHAFSPLRDGCCADNISSCHSINLFCSCWISQWRNVVLCRIYHTAWAPDSIGRLPLTKYFSFHNHYRIQTDQSRNVADADCWYPLKVLTKKCLQWK